MCTSPRLTAKCWFTVPYNQRSAEATKKNTNSFIFGVRITDITFQPFQIILLHQHYYPYPEHSQEYKIQILLSWQTYNIAASWLSSLLPPWHQLWRFSAASDAHLHQFACRLRTLCASSNQCRHQRRWRCWCVDWCSRPWSGVTNHPVGRNKIRAKISVLFLPRSPESRMTHMEIYIWWFSCVGGYRDQTY